ncbi:restriction endonuclease subunit S, partial [Campylobacter helveticus]|uniref:restriction endonuclease subunit S n=1 Tax=Campylobacter helveticus TaxID=28898 RepID=UPI00242E86DD
MSSSKKIFHANQITIYNDEIPNSYPYVVCSTRNNGVRGYLCENRKYLNPANTLSFAQDTFSVFYQEKPYFTGNKVKVLTPKFKPFTKIHALFFASIYQKVLETFTWGVGSTEDDIKDIVISLPVLPKAESKDYQIAFDFMESYIKAIEKQHIEKIYAFWESKLKAYNTVINGGGGLNLTHLNLKNNRPNDNGND